MQNDKNNMYIVHMYDQLQEKVKLKTNLTKLLLQSLAKIQSYNL